MSEPQSDPLGRLFEQLRGQPPPVPFAPAEAVRRRGRQRTFHQAISAGVAVLAVTGLGAGGVVTAWPDPDPAPPAATPMLSEPATSIPGDWVLTADDLAGGRWRHDVGDLIEGPWYWDGPGWCPEYSIDDYPSVAQRIDLETTGWRRGTERVDQLVELFPPGVAAENLDDVRAYVDLCSRRTSPDGTVAGTLYAIVETGFAGDQSLLIRVDPYHFNDTDEIAPAGIAHDVAVVQVGDAVTTIRFAARVDAEEVARAAATRLAR